MKVAVLTLTRDRLAYSQHCFQTLRDNAGCEFDWYVLDQASTDGTPEWLLDQDDLDVTVADENLGVCKGLNVLLGEACDPAEYDVIVRYDNDCEVLQPNTLRGICEFPLRYDAIVGPHVKGLRNPPPILGRREFAADRILDERNYIHHSFILSQVHHLGGIFMAIPAALFESYRYDETQPPWGGDELICPWLSARGGVVGYLDGWEVNHYLTTDGQANDDIVYWDRKTAEMAA